eukprot:7011521-Prorocentrum_lima.AAC.1
MACCDILKQNNMNMGLMQLANHLQTTHGNLLATDAWIVSPPRGGVSALARQHRDASKSNQALTIH